MGSIPTDKKMYWEHKLIELLNADNADNSTVHFKYTTAAENIFKSRGTTSMKLDTDKLIEGLFGMADPASKDKYVTLDVITYNPKKEATFNLMTVQSTTQESAAEAAYGELINMRGNKEYSSYTLEWMQHGTGKSQRSYFYAKNEFEVLTKFYFNMGPENVEFYSLTVNPLS